MSGRHNKLAINNGQKTVNLPEPHFAWPPITQEMEKAVIKQLYDSISIYNKSGIIDKLEKKFADYYGRKYALLTNSGTSAIHSMFVAANLKADDEIICPAYTFFASVTPLFFTGAMPILCDSGKDGNIDPDQIELKITSKTKGICVTHMWGLPCEMDRITEIARKHNFLLFEDFSHAQGATFKGRNVGSFGDIVASSLQAQKVVTGGEGGILLTDDDEMYYRAMLLGHYNKRCLQEIPKEHSLYKYSVTGMGLKFRIHPLAAALASQQLDNLKNYLRGRKEFAMKMIDSLSNLQGIQLPEFRKDIQHAWYAFVLQYKKEELDNLSIDRVYEAIIAEGCSEVDRPKSICPLNYLPLFQDPGPLFSSYKNKISYCIGDFPCAEKFHESAIKLPVWHDPNDDIICNMYIQAITKVIKNYKELFL